MKRTSVLLYAFLVAFAIIMVKLSIIQLFGSEKYVPHEYLKTEQTVPQRGRILDRNGSILVTNQPIYRIYADIKNLKDISRTIYVLDKVLQQGDATLSAKLDTKKSWVPIAQNVSQEQKQRIEKNSLKGIVFEGGSRRYYPEASAAAHLIGFVGKDQDSDPIGYFGIEGYYNKDLEGLPGILKTERDVLGRPIFVGTQDKLSGEDGRDLTLTIDMRTQRLIKQKLEKALEQYEAKSGCITVARPKTMEIMGLVCLPDYDPGNYFSYSEEYFRNPVVTNSFEPGSIFKPLVVAAALEEKAIKPTTIINEDGPMKIGKYYIRTWNDEYNGKVDITKVLQTSSNVGMVQIGAKMKRYVMMDYFEDFGFGDETGIDIQGESRSPLKQGIWRDIDYATATFGQGIAVTQIQMLTAFASLVNGGWVMKPQVVKEKGSVIGKTEVMSPRKIRRVISEKTSEEIKKMLQAAVEGGEAHWKVPKGYTFGGKTGTAQIAVQGTYDAEKTNASFIGFSPVENPEFIMLVTLHQPAASPWASETAAPLFFEVASDLIVQYNIPPR